VQWIRMEITTIWKILKGRYVGATVFGVKA